LLLSNASADVGGLGGNGDDFVPAPPPPATANIDDGGAATHASTHNVLNVISPAGTCNTAASSSSSMAAAAATDATKFLHELKSPGDFSHPSRWINARWKLVDAQILTEHRNLLLTNTEEWVNTNVKNHDYFLSNVSVVV
jgi:hypothetical protein